MGHAVNIWTSAGGLGAFVKMPYWWNSCPLNSCKVTTPSCQGSSSKLFSPSLPTLCISLSVFVRILIWCNRDHNVVSEVCELRRWLICMGSNWPGCVWASPVTSGCARAFFFFHSFPVLYPSPTSWRHFLFKCQFSIASFGFKCVSILQLCEMLLFFYKTHFCEVFAELYSAVFGYFWRSYRSRMWHQYGLHISFHTVLFRLCVVVLSLIVRYICPLTDL